MSTERTIKALKLHGSVCEVVDVPANDAGIRVAIGMCNPEIKRQTPMTVFTGVSLPGSMRMFVNAARPFDKNAINFGASKIYMHFGGISMISGPALICSVEPDNTRKLVDLREENYEKICKILTTYGFVKGGK